MGKKYKISAIITAAGSGKRMGSDIPKQYQNIGSDQVLERSIRTFYNNKLIDKICVVISAGHDKFFERIKAKFGSKLIYCRGGEFRQESVYQGLIRLKEYSPDIVLIHDAARPFVSEKLIGDVINALNDNKAVMPAVKVKDTIKIAENDAVKETPDRNKLYIAQTPQGFNFDLIYDLHKKYKGTNFTDDIILTEKDGIKIKIVEGEYSNYKITTRDDLVRARMENGRKLRTGSGFDVHQFENGEGITLCGVKIPFNKKLKGHSDADCAWHAVTDALLGAAGLGDIGEHFPDSEKKWQGADSSIFLRFAADEIRKNGGEINNIDITVICEEPKLRSYKEAMKMKTAEVLGLSPEQVNIKATTTESLGSLGRKEGLAAMASTSIVL